MGKNPVEMFDKYTEEFGGILIATSIGDLYLLIESIEYYLIT